MAISKFFKGVGIISVVILSITASSVLFAEDPPTVVWNKVYDSGNNEIAWGIAVDGAGNVFTAAQRGNATNSDFLVIKYNSDGDTVWTRSYNPGDSAAAYDVTVDESGNVYATGVAKNANYDYVTIKYDTDGNEKWLEPAIYNSLSQDGAYGVAVDASGNVYVGGTAHGKFVTVKYDSAGTQIWDKQYATASDAGSHGVAVDEAGNIYSSGWFNNLTTTDFVTVKYTPDGDTLWTKIFDSGNTDGAFAVATRGGYVYVTGASTGSVNNDCRTIKYDSDGNLQWNMTYDSDSGDVATGIAVDASGNSYLSCGSDFDYLTIKYNPDGDTLWTKLQDSGEDEGAWAVAVDDEGYVYVTGGTWNGANYDIRTIKYRQNLGIEEKSLVTSSSSLDVIEASGSSVTLRYSLGNLTSGNLTFYSVEGRFIKDFTLSQGSSTFSWDTRNVPSGVYFARLEAGNTSTAAKVFIVR